MKTPENIEQIHQKFIQFGSNAKKWIHECKLLLPEIAEKRIWEHKGFSSIYEYAGKLAGLSHGQVDDALWILRKAFDKPELMAVARTKGINSIRPVVSIATKQNAGFFAKKALEMGKNTLAVYVRGLRKVAQDTENEQSLLEGEEFRTGPKTLTNEQAVFLRDATPAGAQTIVSIKIISMELSPETAAELEKLKINDWDELMKMFLKLHREKLEEQKPQKKVTKSRYISKKIQEFILKRSGGHCEFPHCRRKYEDFHHTERFAMKKEHDPDKIRALCKAHHDLMHHNLVENETKDPKNWQMRLSANVTDYAHVIDKKVQQHKLNFLKQVTALPMQAGP